MNVRESIVVIDHDLKRLSKDESLINYIAHAVCTQGEARVTFNGEDYILRPCHCMVLPLQYLMTDVQVSDDFQGLCAYVHPEMIQTPNPSPGAPKVIGSMSIFHHPLIQLSKEEMNQLLKDIKEVEYRKQCDRSPFYDEGVYYALQMMLLDFFELYAKGVKDAETPIQYVELIVKFMTMLRNGDYIRNRKLDYYADKLHVSAKYLSNVMHTFTGNGASYWINRFTMVHLCKLARDPSRTFSSIAEEFNFSSPSHFYKFFEKQVGISPSAFRKL